MYVFLCVCFSFPGDLFQLPAVRVLVSSAEESEKNTIFSCFANGFSPKKHEIKWFKNDKEVTSKVSESNTPVKEEARLSNGTLYSVASFLTVQNSEWELNTNFTCQFKSKNEQGHDEYQSGSVKNKASNGKCLKVVVFFFVFKAFH